MNTQTKQSISADQTNTETVHIPVLLQEVIEQLDLQSGDVVFDGTFGGGGYSRAIVDRIGSNGVVVATDQDPLVHERFAQDPSSQIELIHANFSEIAKHYNGKFNKAVLDLGISSDQLANRSRGISFQDPESPLDMRMDTTRDLTAWAVLQVWDEEEIANALYRYADERYSRRIARAIVERRESDLDLETVGDLVETIESVLPRRGKTHPATKTFQALRIVVNDELGHLERFLQHIPDQMVSGGRLVIVSFHSLEDRIVKQTFKQWQQDGYGTILTKKPIAPTQDELTKNPRSRSSKLRTFEFK